MVGERCKNTYSKGNGGLWPALCPLEADDGVPVCGAPDRIRNAER